MDIAIGFNARGWLISKTSWILMSLGLVFACGARVGAATLSAALDRDTIYEGETAEVAVTVSNARSEGTPVPPEVENLTFQLTPTYESRQSFFNGVLTSSRVYRFVVQPAGTGEYDIPSFSLEVDGVTLRTRPMRLRVLMGQNPSTSRIAFLQLKTEKQRVYLGEALPVEIGVGYRAGNYRGVPQLEQEGLTMGRMERLPSRVERFAGADYRVDPYRNYVVAARVGGLRLGPAKLPFGLPVRSRLGLFSGEFTQVELRSGAIDLEVVPLPTEGVPDGFNGAVGQYTMEVEASTNAVVAGDPILLTIEIRGQGSVESLQLESLEDWEGFKTYAPETSVELKDNVGLDGTKRFTQVVIPQSVQVTELPSIRFSYFDPASASYKTLVKAALPLTVRRGAMVPAYPGMRDATGSDAGEPVAEREIVHIKTRLGTYGAIQSPLVTRPWFLGFHALPLVAWLGTMCWRWRQKKLAADPILRRRKQVSRIIRQGLLGLREAADANDPEVFFGIVFRLLQERLGEKSGLPASAIDEMNLDDVLRGRGDDSLLAEVHGLFRACNAARYAPGRVNETLDSFIPKVEEVLSRIERLK